MKLGRYLAITILVFSSVIAFGQKKMPKINNPNGQGFIPCGSCDQPKNISSETTIAEKERGERLTISGTVYQADGKTPAKEIILFFYHTDATGHYNKEDDPNDPRLKGWVITNAAGQYQFHTIKPAPYPKLTTPAHIHVHLYGKNVPENWIDDFWFDGDTIIKEADKLKYENLGSFSPIVKLVKVDGYLTGKRDIKLR